MSENKKEILDAIMRAMEMEKETFDFYTTAEQKTFDQGGKRIFRWLAKTEEAHYQTLTELYNSLNDGGRWVFYGGTTIPLEPEEVGAPHVGLSTGDLEALEIAMDIERKGIAYFDALAAKTADPDGRAMLVSLGNEEREHLRVITEKYQAVKSKG
jgi:rubrerythrin